MGIVRRWVILPLIGSLFVVCSGKSWGAGDCRSWVRAGFRTILFGNTPREQSFRFSSSEIILGDKNIPAIGASLGEVFSIQSQQGQNARGYWRTHKAGDRVVGVEIRNIKNLNESILGISQTEMFLEAFKIRLHQRLQNYYPGRGIVFSNFKRLFVWFPADLNVFRSDVLEPVIEKVAEDVAGLAIATGRDFNWPKFLRENVSLSEGKSKGIASLNLSLQNTRRIPRAALANEIAFSNFASSIRRQLVDGLSKRGLSIDDLLQYLRNATAKPNGMEAMSSWLNSLRLSHLYEVALTYLDILRSAEYLPHADASQLPRSLEEFVNYRKAEPFGRFRGSWELERRVFKVNSSNADYVFITDVRNLGFTGYKALDRWVMRGAYLGQLESTFDATTKAMEDRIRGVRRALVESLERYGPKPEVQVYQSGDDAIWSVSKLTPLQQVGLEGFLKSLSQEKAEYKGPGFEFDVAYHVSAPVKLKMEGSLFEVAMEEAIAEARKTLKDER